MTLYDKYQQGIKEALEKFGAPSVITRPLRALGGALGSGGNATRVLAPSKFVPGPNTFMGRRPLVGAKSLPPTPFKPPTLQSNFEAAQLSPTHAVGTEVAPKPVGNFHFDPFSGSDFKIKRGQEEFNKGAAAALKTFVTNKTTAKPGKSPIASKSHLMNTQVPSSSTTNIPSALEQEDRANSLSQQAMNHVLKLGLDQTKKCTTCKEPQHYGNCKSTPFIRMRLKGAEFNMSMYGSDGAESNMIRPTQSTHESGRIQGRINENPQLTGTSSFTELQKALNSMIADESSNMTGSLNKVALVPIENRGPTSNPYEQRPQHMRHITFNPESQKDQIDKVFNSFDIPHDASGLDSMTPTPELLI